MSTPAETAVPVSRLPRPTSATQFVGKVIDGASQNARDEPVFFAFFGIALLALISLTLATTLGAEHPVFKVLNWGLLCVLVVLAAYACISPRKIPFSCQLRGHKFGSVADDTSTMRDIEARQAIPTVA